MEPKFEFLRYCEPFCDSFQGLSHNLPVGNVKKRLQFVDRYVSEMVAEGTNKFKAFS